MSDKVNPLADLFAMVAEEKERSEKDNKALEELSNFMNTLAVVHPEDVPEEIREEVLEQAIEPEQVSIEVEDLVRQVKEQALKELKEEGVDIFGTSPSVKTQDPLTPFDQKYATKEEMQRHYTNFLTRIQQQLSTLGGGGEVKFLRLDDVARQTANDNWVLEYDAATGKVQFTHNIGPINTVKFDVNHVEDYVVTEGTLCWSNPDRTLNIHHQNGVTQQVGQETYFVVKNVTGQDIPNGTFCRFDGVTQNGINRLDAAPFLADGTYPNLYGMGVATEDIANNAIGFVTNFGMVRDLNTTGSDVGEEWQAGQILFASPTNAGKLTNVKPTAPNNVLPVAAVVVVSNTAGEIFVRPTFEQKQDYGRFARTTVQTANTVNTAYAIGFNNTEISNGITIGTPNSRFIVSQSGFYQFDVSSQVSASSNKGIVYLWYRKNGTDIPYSSRRATITNNDTLTFNSTLQISMDANDYVEIVWATNASGITLDANPTPTVGPSVASVLVSVAQIQL